MKPNGACIIRNTFFNDENQNKVESRKSNQNWRSEGYGASADDGQAIKSARGMPWHQEPMKDVTSCDKPRGGANIH